SPWLRWEDVWRPWTASRGCRRRLHLAGAAAFGGGVGDRLGAERRNRWQRRPARRERRGRRRWRPAWRERRGRWREAGLAREAHPVEEAGLTREARPAVEATSVRGAADGCDAVFGARRLASRGRRCRGPTCRQRLRGGGSIGASAVDSPVVSSG
ncbi:Os04g0429450, partial [Oryza sativa Japonica Group]